MRTHITVLSVIFLLSLVSVSNVLVSDYNFQKGSLLFGYLDGKGGNYDGDGNIIVNNNQDYMTTNGTENNLIKVASADTSFWGNYTASSVAAVSAPTDEAEAQTISSGQEEKVSFSPMTVQGNFLMSPSSFYDGISEEQRYGIIKYTVQEGDTPGSIATSFGISLYTVLWSNNMKVGDYIKPGQVMEVLPVTGVKHLVEEKDTIEAIATKYKAEIQEIIVFNELPANGKLTAGRTLIIPNGEKEKPVAEPKPVVTATRNPGTVVSSGKYVATATAKKGHIFPYGQCTWYVSTRTYVPWGGNAKTWLANAAAYGYATGRTPAAGAIVVTNEHRVYGHVAYVESVTASTITISEMNYVGWARKSVRVIPRNSSVIMGFVYAK